MKKITTVVSLMLMVGTFLPVAASAASCGDLDGNGNTIVCGNGSPETVSNVWGGTNSSVPHVQPGAIVRDAAGIASLCPSWFTNYCVDISNTEYYKSAARATARQLQTAGFSVGLYSYWLTH